MIFKNHIGVIALLIIACNLAEMFNDRRFNRPGCDHWAIPTAAAFLCFAIVEVVGWVIYLCFIV